MTASGKLWVDGGGRMRLKTIKYWMTIIGVMSLTACANFGSHSPHEIASYRTSDPEPPAVVDPELEIIPTEENALVNNWIAYFQGKGRPHMERYLARSSRYSGLMKRILRQNGLPEDLIYIALIESGFSSRATSHAAAVGYWQFIKGTGRRYGLEINSMVDERRDPVLSTQAAAEYFKGLYSVFGSWYLAMASYNAGENKIKREVMNHYTRDFWELARKKRFRKETINYVPKFIAAKMIAKDPAKYGFTEIEWEKPVEFELVKIDKPVNLKQMAAAMNMEYDDFKQLNPKFRGEIAPLKNNRVLELRVPVGQMAVAMEAAQKSAVNKVEFVADAGETQTYRVRSGDSLYTIARKYRTTVAWLRDANDLQAKRKLRIGQRLQVPDHSGGYRTVAKVKPAKKAVIKEVAKTDDVEKAVNAEINMAGTVYYIVQPGDTLSEIAEAYDSSVSELRRMNKLSKRQLLRPGVKLKVPKDDGLPSDPGAVASARQPSSQIMTSSDGVSHVVKSGENLTTIAKKYGVTVQALQKANNLKRRTMLKVGYKLKIPLEKRTDAINGSRYSKKKSKLANKSSRTKIHLARRANISDL